MNWCNILQKYNDIPYSEVSITCGETKLVVVIDKVNRCTYPPELNVVASYMLLNLIHIEIPRFGLLSSIIYSIKQHTKRICNEKLIEIEKLIVNNHNLTLSDPYKPSAQELRYKVRLVKDMAIQALNGVYIRTKDEEDAVDLPTTYKVNNPDKLTLHNKQKSSRVLSVADYVVTKTIEIYKKYEVETKPKNYKKQLLAPYYVAACDLNLMRNDWTAQLLCEKVGVNNIVTETDWRHYIPMNRHEPDRFFNDIELRECREFFEKIAKEMQS